ncbi:ATP-binding cassette domain-containing protein [Anaerolineales bacterium HSG6]|nr:ATP-binding cassette domain-containing protein [Anaerolineales bacterium HSG6]
MTTIQIRDLSKTYSDPTNANSVSSPEPLRYALNKIFLTVPHGQTCALLGPSGCGKTTLLKVIAGIETDYTGTVFYDEQNINNILPKDRHIGMVFQNYALYPHFKGLGNLTFSFKVRKAPDAEIEERVRITSEIMGVGFNDLLKQKPGHLSGGEQQRLAIGRAIVRNPRVFLFDEPLANLDAKLRSKTRLEIKRLLHKFQITTFYVTHDQDEAITIADIIAVMRDGKIEQVGTYRRLREHPDTIFVASFVGRPAMNMFSGGTVQSGWIHLNEMIMPIPATYKTYLHDGNKITVGIRPEKTCLVEQVIGTPDGSILNGLIDHIEPDFAQQRQLLHLKTGSQQYIATCPLNNSHKIGDRVDIFLPADQLYFFNSQTERRITTI